MRYNALDAWRGLACIGMLFFHMEAVRMFILVNPSVWLFEWPGVWLGQFVRISFLLLVGVSTYLIYKNNSFPNFASKQFRRFLKVGLAALIVTIVSYLVFPNYYIIFGILHLIAIGNLLMIGFSKFPKFLSVIMGIGFIAMGYSELNIEFGKWANFLLGMPYEGFVSFDYFPLVPWFGYILIGYGLGEYIVKFMSGIEVSDGNLFVWLGKRALEFYLIHMALIYVFWKILLVAVKF